MGTRVDLTGMEFGNLIAEEPAQIGFITKTGYIYICKCKCGEEVAVLRSTLIAKEMTDCGCGCSKPKKKKRLKLVARKRT